MTLHFLTGRTGCGLRGLGRLTGLPGSRTYLGETAGLGSGHDG